MTPDTKQMLARYQPKMAKQIQPEQQLGIARFSSDGKLLAAGDFTGGVRRFDASADLFTALPALTGHNGWVTGVVFHSDGKRLFTTDSWGRMRAWPFAEKEPKPTWDVAQAHDGWIRCLALSPDGNTLATCGRDRMIRLWSAAAGKKQAEFDNGEDVHAVAFHPDGKSLVSADLRGVIRQWDLKPGTKATRELDAKTMFLVDRLQDVHGVRSLVFDNAGGTLICAGGLPKNGGFTAAGPVLLVYDWATGKLTKTVKLGADSDGWVEDLHWHADGFLMGVISGQPGQGKVFFHRLDDAQPFYQQSYPNCHSLAVHPDGRRIVVATTNANSAGNGRAVGQKEGYPGNFSPLVVLDMPKT